jgi:hypothetical protein
MDAMKQMQLEQEKLQPLKYSSIERKATKKTHKKLLFLSELTAKKNTSYK